VSGSRAQIIRVFLNLRIAKAKDARSTGPRRTRPNYTETRRGRLAGHAAETGQDARTALAYGDLEQYTERAMSRFMLTTATAVGDVDIDKLLPSTLARKRSHRHGGSPAGALRAHWGRIRQRGEEFNEKPRRRRAGFREESCLPAGSLRIPRRGRYGFREAPMTGWSPRPDGCCSSTTVRQPMDRAEYPLLIRI